MLRAWRLAVMGLVLGVSVSAWAQPFPRGGDVIPAGTRIWVTPSGLDDRWQKGVIVEERLHLNSYMVRTDAYRDQPAQTFNVHWKHVQRLTNECAPPAHGTALLGQDKC